MNQPNEREVSGAHVITRTEVNQPNGREVSGGNAIPPVEVNQPNERELGSAHVITRTGGESTKRRQICAVHVVPGTEVSQPNERDVSGPQNAQNRQFSRFQNGPTQLCMLEHGLRLPYSPQLTSASCNSRFAVSIASLAMPSAFFNLRTSSSFSGNSF